ANGAVGEILLARGSRAEAAQHFETALKTNPEHLLALWNLARIALDEGRVAEAVERCQSVLEIAADEGGAHYVLGLAAEKQGANPSALKRFALAARFAPDEPEFRAALERAQARADAAQR